MIRPIKIAVCNKKTDAYYKNQEQSWEYLKDRNRTPVRTTETAEEYAGYTKQKRDAIKDIGGFVAGQLKGGRRLKGSVICRSLAVLDADSIENDEVFRQTVSAVLSRYTYFMYSTHSHRPDNPRYRIVILLSRDVTPDEYPAMLRMIAKQIGMDFFDDSTYEVNRMMFWASCPANGVFVFTENDGEALSPDEYLAMYADWRDCSLWPTSSRQSEVAVHNTSKTQADPLTKEGLVGTFCRAYSIDGAIAAYLSDVYRPSAVPGRYDYIKGESTAGLVVYDDKFAYSHHATDPACGKLLNAFDLVRIHKFGDETKSSYTDMCRLASNDPNVGSALLREKQEAAERDFDDWTQGLVLDKNGILCNSLHNITLIMQNDRFMRNIGFNELADGMEITGEVPWKHPSRFWRDNDDSQLVCYVDEHYGTFSQRNYTIAVTKVVDDRSYHPIKDYFGALPDWDGTPRVETLLVDYLGADDNAYVRAVTRKTLCAAYDRIYSPGKKFDYMLVLNGEQGIGKSTLISALGMEWYSDSLSISDMNDKTAAEKLQGYWIHEIGELAGMKKADLDKVKAFISRQDDKYRASFGRRVTPHPRQCVFFGTTNNENGYLRDITGNRRYWNVRLSGAGKYKPWQITQEIVDQIWAEVRVIAEKGERLYLDAELEAYAKEEQRHAMERDDREGLVIEYLEMLLPDGWNSMDMYARRNYVRDMDDPTRPVGRHRRTEVSNIEIWCECFGKAKEDIRPSDSYAISAIMVRIDGWERSSARSVQPLYGRQRIYKRID